MQSMERWPQCYCRGSNLHSDTHCTIPRVNICHECVQLTVGSGYHVLDVGLMRSQEPGTGARRKEAGPLAAEENCRSQGKDVQEGDQGQTLPSVTKSQGLTRPRSQGTLLSLLPFFPSLNCVSLGRVTARGSPQRQRAFCFYMTSRKSPHGLLGYLLKTNKGSDNQWVGQRPRL